MSLSRRLFDFRPADGCLGVCVGRVVCGVAVLVVAAAGVVVRIAATRFVTVADGVNLRGVGPRVVTWARCCAVIVFGRASRDGCVGDGWDALRLRWTSAVRSSHPRIYAAHSAGSRRSWSSGIRLTLTAVLPGSAPVDCSMRLLRSSSSATCWIGSLLLVVSLFWSSGRAMLEVSTEIRSCQLSYYFSRASAVCVCVCVCVCVFLYNYVVCCSVRHVARFRQDTCIFRGCCWLVRKTPFPTCFSSLTGPHHFGAKPAWNP